jgi:protein-S-isoprenylcysteine O-methyltransferase Ste14
MIGITIPDWLLIFLRSMLLLGPLTLMLYLGWASRKKNRFLVGALFSFLYSMGLLLPVHALAIQLGLWHYGGHALMLLGMPADLWFGGSLLFGPAIFLAFPGLSPWVFTRACVALQGLVFRSLDPFVIAGQGWFIGVVLVFLIVHVPSLYLAQWTGNNERLALRTALLAFGYGFLAFFVLPTLIMQAMGGSWDLLERPIWSFWATAAALAPLMVIGLNGVQMFVVHGQGTPIPLDGTKCFVRSGLYSYVRNPMQLCSAASWIVIGLFLHSFFVALAAAMAVVFVLGMVRWHHRNDLEVRFHQDWLEYKEFVPEWFPRWRPWIKQASKFSCNSNSPLSKAYIEWLKKYAVGLDFSESGANGIVYVDGNSGMIFAGLPALIYPLFNINFVTSLIGAALLLALLPWQLFCQLAKKHPVVAQ